MEQEGAVPEGRAGKGRRSGSRAPSPRSPHRGRGRGRRPSGPLGAQSPSAPWPQTSAPAGGSGLRCAGTRRPRAVAPATRRPACTLGLRRRFARRTADLRPASLIETQGLTRRDFPPCRKGWPRQKKVPALPRGVENSAGSGGPSTAPGRWGAVLAVMGATGPGPKADLWHLLLSAFLGPGRLQSVRWEKLLLR